MEIGKQIKKYSNEAFTGCVGRKNICISPWTCYNRTKLRETQQNQGFALI